MVLFFYKIEAWGSQFLSKKLQVALWYLLKYTLNVILPLYYKLKKSGSGLSANKIVKENVIISLTSFPARMKSLPLVLESLLRQTVKADRIILWLADVQYPDKDSVSEKLKKFIDRGIEVRYCEDLRSHKKYYYTIKENPSALVITVDDDILYPENMLQRLLETYTKWPNCIITQRAHKMTFDSIGLQPYDKWNQLAKGCLGPDMYLCQTGGAGCLYPPGALDERVFNISLIKQLCPLADDLWMKTMSYIKGTKVILTGKDNPEILDVIGNKNNGLAKTNVEDSQNDKQLKAITEYFHINWRQYL